MSLRVSDGIGTGTPGTFTPLCDATTPPVTTVQRARPRSTDSTRRWMSPSSMRMSWPRWSTSPTAVGLTGSSPSFADFLGGDDHLVAAVERDGLGEVADPDLRALEVGDDRDRPLDLLRDLAHDLHPLRVVLVRPVREVQPRGVHPGARELEHASRARTTRARASRRSSSGEAARRT